MICKKCNAHVEDGEIICPACGAEMEPEQVEPNEKPWVIQEELTITPREAAEEVGNKYWITEDEPAEPLPDNHEKVETLSAEAEEEAETVPARKKTWVRVTAIVACIALFLGLAASVWYGVNGGWLPKENDVQLKGQYFAEKEKAVSVADTVIATIGDKELTNSQLQVFYMMGIYEFLQNYSSYISYLGLDLTKPLYEQYVEEGGQTWEQYFLQGALNTWHSYQSMLLVAEKEGFKIPEQLIEQIDAVVDSMEVSAVGYGFANGDELVQADMGPSSDMAAYRYYMDVYYGGMSYFEDMYNKIDPTDDEIAAYYEEHADLINSQYSVSKESGKLIDVRHILVCPTGGTTDENNQTVYSEDEWAECLAKAEDILKQWQEGEATEDSFAALAMEKTEDPGSQGTGGLYTYVYEGQMVPAFNDWCFDESRQYGDTDIVKTSYGYHIMFFVNGEEGWIRRTKDEMVSEKCSEAMDQALEAYPMEVNYKKIVLGKADMAY